MGSALLNTETTDSTFAPPAESAAAGQSPAALAGSAAALRLQAAERLAAHRNRRGTPQTRPAPEPSRPATSRAARIAATVAERYANTQTYRAFLAAEAERAVQQARAAAEIAALNAQAVAAAQQALLDTFDQATFDQHASEHDQDADGDITATAEPREQQGSQDSVELSLWPDLDAAPTLRPRRHTRAHPPANEFQPANREPRASNLPLTVRFYDDDASAAHVGLEASHRTAPAPRTTLRPDRNDPEARALDEEIAFRQAPVFEEPAGPPMPLPANLIEFPRQLVASRKARPRLAEGPLRDETSSVPADGQLRIFEVDPAQISTTPDAETAVEAEFPDPAPQWTSIWLDAPGDAAPTQDTATRPGAQTNASATQRPVPLQNVATLGRRTLAAAINAAIVFAGVLAFAASFAMVAGHIRPWQPVAHGSLAQVITQAGVQTGIQVRQLPAAVAVTAGLLLLVYQALFFYFSTATPGMRCVRIALCTFDDENPTRKAMRRRILAVLLSACPVGLGFLWAALDDDRLAWHDRLSRMYQRSY